MTFTDQLIIILPFIIALIIYAYSWKFAGPQYVDLTYYVALVAQLIGIGQLYWMSRATA